jgi:transcriptional regulator of acetoin/glycerol metabolism
MGSIAELAGQTRVGLERTSAASLSVAMPPNAIRDSWQRCIDAGLDPGQAPREVRASSQELRGLLDQESFLLRAARAEFHQLQRQLPEHDCLLGFTNKNSVLVDVFCSNPVVRAASKAEPGTCWEERFRGTNAIGTAAFSRSPVAVTLHEHFLRYYGALTCVAAPISDPDGDMVGVIHVSSHRPIRPRHTLLLLSMSAMHIESELFRERYRSEFVLQFHCRNEFADTIDAGLIAFNQDGWILSSNCQARFFLQDLPVASGHHFDEIFRVPFRQFLARPEPAPELRQLVDVKGSTSYVRLHASGGHAKRRAVPGRGSDATPAVRPSAGFVCSDPAVAHAVTTAKRALALRLPILLQGETGTGKEMLAQHAHDLSGRKGRFVAVNCAAVPESLIEAELFGYRDGAFTGARSGGAEGLVVQADGGTLFLDEIGDMPMNLQPALLRLLDNWTVRPIGSSREMKVDVQLITATNCDMEEAVADKRFRRDLLHRINTVEISLPPLRERSDFDEIVTDLLRRIAPEVRIEQDALSILRQQSWAGNVRELRNILSRAILTLSSGESNLSAETVRPFLRNHSHATPAVCKPVSVLLDLRRQAIVEAYEKNNGNISKTAQSLSVSRNTLYRELRHAGLIGPEPTPRPS